MPLLVSPGIAGTVLTRHGSPEQKDRWLRGIGTGRHNFAFAITEPDAGSNSHKISTRARRDGADWVLSGTKTYISGVEWCDGLLVMARTGEDAGTGRGRLTMFIVDPDADGLTRQDIPTAVEAPEHQSTLFFDDVRVGPDRMVGGEGEGLRIGFDGLNPERILAAAICTGDRPLRARQGGRVRERAGGLGQADRHAPGHRPSARRGEGRDRGRAADDLEGGAAARRRRAGR